MRHEIVYAVQNRLNFKKDVNMTLHKYCLPVEKSQFQILRVFSFPFL